MCENSRKYLQKSNTKTVPLRKNITFVLLERTRKPDAESKPTTQITAKIIAPANTADEAVADTSCWPGAAE